MEVQKWSAKKIGHRHALQADRKVLEAAIDHLYLYQGRLRNPRVRRSTQLSITDNDTLLRAGSNVYILDDSGYFILIKLGESSTHYVSDICRTGSWIAIVQRRGVELADPTDDPTNDLTDIFPTDVYPNIESKSHSYISSSSTGSPESSSDNSSVYSREGDLSDTESYRSYNGATSDSQLEADSMAGDSETSTSARESHSDGSTEVSDEILDERISNNLLSENESLVIQDMDQLDESSSGSTSLNEQEDGLDSLINRENLRRESSRASTERASRLALFSDPRWYPFRPSLSLVCSSLAGLAQISI